VLRPGGSENGKDVGRNYDPWVGPLVGFIRSEKMEALRIALNSMKAAEKVLASQGYILRWKITVESSTGFLRGIEDTPEEDDGQPVLKPEQVQETISESKPSTAQPQEATQTSKHRPKQAAEGIRPVTALCLTDAAAYLGMSIAGVYDRIKSGRIPAHGGKIGNRWFLTEELDQYLESRKRRGLRGK